MENITCKQQLLWTAIAQDSTDFEQGMDKFRRKQTGSYYTALSLTLTMMQELIDSLDSAKKKSLYKLKFLEPCAGTGNFIYAYLRACKSLGFSREENEELLNNIYACDINVQALSIYKKNLSAFAKEWFDIKLDKKYFENHIAGGLLFDVDADEICYTPIDKIFSHSVIKNGFDIVVTNPPYKNLKAEKSHYQTSSGYEINKEKYNIVNKLSLMNFSYSVTGTLNIYKMFVEEIIEHYLAADGVGSLLIPATILSDKTCTNLRTRILNTCSIQSLHLIPENNNYVDASQALCAMLFHKGKTTQKITIDGSFTEKPQHKTEVSIEDIIDPATGNAILVLANNEYFIRKLMKRFQSIKEISYINNLRGELDLTLNKTSITEYETQYRLFRGRNIGFYSTLPSLPMEYVVEDFVQSTAKKQYIFRERLVCQQIVNMSKKRRIAFSLVPKHIVLGNSCNFISINENADEVDIFFLLGVLNSSLIDWYFKLTSSNNHINNYEIDNFPIPVAYERKGEISKLVKQYLKSYDETLLATIDGLVSEAYGITSDFPILEDTVKVNSSLIFDPPKGSLQSNEAIFSLIQQDLSQIIPNISITECQSILNKQSSCQTICFSKNPDICVFDKKVITSIENKYQKIYYGEILNHTTFKLSDLDLEMIRSVPQGGSWKDISPKTVKKSKRLSRITETGGRTTLYGRIDYSKPSYTITTYFNRPGNGTYVHPTHERVISVREAARFQCFPDNYYFYGTKTDILKQVGNAVPVLLAYCIGKAIREKTHCSRSVDLFSGAGGMTYGFKRAGINAIIANDIMESACVTLKTNCPEIPVLCGDVTSESIKQKLIQAGIKGKADIICGGPPCQGFSMAGFRSADDPRNQLFRDFIDIVSGVNPKIIVFENVEGLLSYQNGETYRNIIELFSQLGYVAEGRSLFANHYGVPQRRKRVIILCIRKDIGITPTEIFPQAITPNFDKQVNAYETIYDLDDIECSEFAKYSSSYSSSILQYLKGEISIDAFFEKVSDNVTIKSDEQKMKCSCQRLENINS